MNSVIPNDSGIKPTIAVFCNLIGMALQNKMPWGMLANTLDCIIPSFEESKQVIKILLKELENLQLRLMKKENDDMGETSKAFDLVENRNEQVNEIDDSLPENETIEDDIEVLEVVKERIDEEMYLMLDEQTKTSDVGEADKVMTEIDEHNLDNEIVNQTISGIDNQWYTFVKNDKTCDKKAKFMVETREFKADETKETESLITAAKDITATPKVNKALFECDICKKGFDYKNYLNRHKRIHAGKANFECEICKKSFSSKRDLKRHERIHTGEVPYECKICKKRFKRSCALKRHQRVHIVN